MSDESSTSSLVSVGSDAPFYTTSYVIELGRFPGGRRHRSEFRGAGVVEITESGLILRCMQRRSWLWVLPVSLLVWSVFDLVFMHALVAVPGFVSVLRFYGLQVYTFELLVFVAIYVAVRDFAGRQLADIHLDPSICRAHYVREWHCVVIERPKGKWIDMTPLSANESRFVADVRGRFGGRFAADSRVVLSDWAVQLASRPLTDRSTISRCIREALGRQVDRLEEDVTEDTPLGADPSGAGADMADLLAAVRADYDVDLTQADQERLVTAKDLIDVVYGKLHPTDQPVS